MDFKNGSIGFFDSGIGGISILGKTMYQNNILNVFF